MVKYNHTPSYLCLVGLWPQGCNPEDPIALHLHDPSGDGYQTEFSFTMPRPYRTGRFNMVVWGVDQDHTPCNTELVVGRWRLTAD